MKCKWSIRPGKCNTLWAFTPCRNGLNYLSKVDRPEDVKDSYNGRICPICGKIIEIDMHLFGERSEDESE